MGTPEQVMDKEDFIALEQEANNASTSLEIILNNEFQSTSFQGDAFRIQRNKQAANWYSEEVKQKVEGTNNPDYIAAKAVILQTVPDINGKTYQHVKVKDNPEKSLTEITKQDYKNVNNFFHTVFNLPTLEKRQVETNNLRDIFLLISYKPGEAHERLRTTPQIDGPSEKQQLWNAYYERFSDAKISRLNEWLTKHVEEENNKFRKATYREAKKLLEQEISIRNDIRETQRGITTNNGPRLYNKGFDYLNRMIEFSDAFGLGEIRLSDKAREDLQTLRDIALIKEVYEVRTNEERKLNEKYSSRIEKRFQELCCLEKGSAGLGDKRKLDRIRGLYKVINGHRAKYEIKQGMLDNLTNAMKKEKTKYFNLTERKN